MSDVPPELRALLDPAEPMEPLHPDLRLWLELDGPFPCLRSPLIYSLTVLPHMYAMLNRHYEHKKARVKKALEAQDWKTYLFMYERPWRLWAYRKVERLMSDRQRWELLVWTWTDTENVRQDLKHWRQAWSSRRPGREFTMDEDERATLTQLDQRVTIYRGSSALRGIASLSWTLDKTRGEWFARRSALLHHENAKIAYLAQAEVDKSNILAYLAHRNESEIVVLPRWCENIQVTEIKAGRYEPSRNRY